VSPKIGVNVDIRRLVCNFSPEDSGSTFYRNDGIYITERYSPEQNKERTRSIFFVSPFKADR
jgi:hypothetical protein